MKQSQEQLEASQLLQEQSEDVTWAVNVLTGNGEDGDSKSHAAWLLNHVGKYKSSKEADEMIERARFGVNLAPPSHTVRRGGADENHRN